jgi:hypothetical protein
VVQVLTKGADVNNGPVAAVSAKPPSSIEAVGEAHASETSPIGVGKDGRFIAYDDGTVLDTTTNLMWFAKDNGTALSWPDAKSYAEKFNGGGYNDWRLPTLDELKGLYDKAKNSKANCEEPVVATGKAAPDAGNVHLTGLSHLSCIRQWTSQGRSGYHNSVIMFDSYEGKDDLRPRYQDFVGSTGRVLPVRQKNN